MSRGIRLVGGWIVAAVCCMAAPRVDNVLVRMVPPGVTSLVGSHMDALMASPLYEKLAAQQKLPQLDQFARETGFDPRRDVREVLMAYGPAGAVLLARGTFNPKAAPMGADLKLVRHGQYNVYALDAAGYCILDGTLAVAGDLNGVMAALDEWKSGSHLAAQPLLKTLGAVSESTPMWGVSTGFATFLSQNLPRAGNGIDFSAIFKGIESSWFTVNVANGFQAAIHASAATEKDAQTLRDIAKALIGFGRLNVPQDKPELLKFWDTITAEQTGRSFTLNADVSGDLLDQMVRILSAVGDPGGRGGSGRRGRGVQ